MTLSELSDIVLAKDAQFDIYTKNDTQYNIMSHQQRAQQVADNITKRFNVLYKAYEKATNKTPRK